MPDNFELRDSPMSSPMYANPDYKVRQSTSTRSSHESVREYDPLKGDKDYADKDDSKAFYSYVNPDKLAWLKQRSGWASRLSPGRMCCTMSLLFVTAVLLLFGMSGFWVVKSSGGVPVDGQSDPWYPAPRGGTVEEWADSYKKAYELVKQMTLVEKVNITTGTGWSMGMCVGNTGPVTRLGFPSLCLQDGPLGIRFADHITAFPAGVTIGATWNKELMYDKGRAHGIEARLKGIHVALGPTMGPLGRLPAGGRNWEGFGADPVLQGYASALTVMGIQDEGVMATAKHFVANEQEHFRQSWEWGTPNAISSNIDDRTMHEIYAWPFADCIRAGVASVMCSYNQVNNSYACQNSKLINGILKDEMGFQGFVQSDWLAQRSGVASALSGLDMSMPGDGLIWQDGKSLWGGELTKAVLNGTVPVERLDDMVLRVVAAWYQMGQDDQDKWPIGENGGPNFSSWTWEREGLLHPGSDDKTTGVVNKFVEVQQDHNLVARQIAAEGIVMVKNEDNLLPLHHDGTAMTRDANVPLRVGIYGEDAFDNPKGPNACADRACNEYTLAQGWGSGAVEFPYLISPMYAIRANFVPDTVQITNYSTNTPPSSSMHSQHLCMVFVNSDAGEGFASWKDVKGDRPNLYPQKGGDDLVKQVSQNCGNGKAPVIVVVHTVGPTILEKWIDLPNVKAVLIAHLPGQESGSALADVIFGDVNPSGHLPYTIAKAEKDYGPASRILTKPKDLVPQQNFSEGIMIDYRYFDHHNITPRYEFGYGLSYTNFRISAPEVISLIAERSPLPEPRPKPAVEPPQVDRRIPSPHTALFPANFRKLKKFVYPYISFEADAKKRGKYPYPEGYEAVRQPSQAGGVQGGNPDLFNVTALIKVKVENIGDRDGSLVAQIYVQFPANMTNSLNETVVMPPRVLRKWAKILLGKRSSESLSKRDDAGWRLVDDGAKKPTPPSAAMLVFELTRRDVSFWDVGLQNWVLPDGEFRVWLGESSRRFEGENAAGSVIPFPAAPKGDLSDETSKEIM